MSSVITWPLPKAERPSSAGDEVLLDYRQRLALETREREALKRHDDAEQRSVENSADARIRAWEKVHQLRMPSTPLHPVLLVIAAATQLSLDEVLYEQQLRTARRASAEF
jgi:hypothetical protein